MMRYVQNVLISSGFEIFNNSIIDVIFAHVMSSLPVLVSVLYSRSPN